MNDWRTARTRSAWAGLVIGLVCLAGHPIHLEAGPPRPFPLRTAAMRATVEPPLADKPGAVTPALRAVRTAQQTCPIDPPTPVVHIRVRAPATVSQGQNIEYRICVENSAKAPAHHVLVKCPLPQGARFVSAKPEPNVREPELVWQLGTLEPGVCKEICLCLAPTGSADVKCCARVQFEHGQCVTTRVLQPALALRKVGPQRAILYDSLRYCLEVTNTGGVAAKDVHLMDTLPDGLDHKDGQNVLTWDIGTLAPGQQRCVEYEVIAKKVGQLCNQAVATAAGGLVAEADHCVTVNEARIALAKTGPAVRYLNLPAEYRITVTNPGAAPLTNVTVTDALPADLTFMGATHGGRLEGNAVRWALGTLHPGDSRSVEVSLKASAPGHVRNQASVSADRGLSAQAECSTDFMGASALLLEIVDSDDPIEVGEEGTFTVTVRNTGAVPASSVAIAAIAPKEMAIIKATGPADKRKDGQQVKFEPYTIPAGQEARYQVVVKAQQPGDVRFLVEMTADQLRAGGPVREEESVTIYADMDRARPVPAPAPPSPATAPAPLAPVPVPPVTAPTRSPSPANNPAPGAPAGAPSPESPQPPPSPGNAAPASPASPGANPLPAPSADKGIGKP